MKAVHFGAGNIGRGFIGLLLFQSGYEVCFVTRSKKKTSLLQQRNHYQVTLANEAADSVTVDNVTATNIENTGGVAEAVANADLVTTAVGVSALEQIAEAIAKGIEQRIKRGPRFLHVIACENAIGGSTQLKQWVYSYLHPDLRMLADRYIAFPDAAVDRIVPIQHHADLLEVTVEPFYEWVVDRSAVIGAAPEIQGIQYVDSLDPYIERKLFTVNTGHCSAAYYGYLEGYTTIQEVMQNDRLREKIQAVLQETGELLIQKHNFNERQHQNYIRKILRRFSNRNLLDEVVRVARCPIRKLSPNERLVRPTLQAYERGLGISHLISVIAAALLFNHEKDAQVARLQTAIQHQGIHEVITKFLGIPREHPVHEEIAEKYEKLKLTYQKSGILTH